MTAAFVITLASIQAKIDASDLDNDKVNAILMTEAAGSEQYSLETLNEHVDAAIEKDGYLTFLEGISTDPALGAMYTFILTGGPNGVYQLLAKMGGAGLVDKKKVASSAKIVTKKAKKKKLFHKEIWAEIAKHIHAEAAAYFEKNLEEYKKQYPEMAGVETYSDFLWLVKRSTLTSAVEEMKVEQTGVVASASLGYRLDAHTPSRNGGWDPKEGKLTEDGQKRLDEMTAKENAKTEAANENADADADEDVTEEDSGEE